MKNLSVGACYFIIGRVIRQAIDDYYSSNKDNRDSAKRFLFDKNVLEEYLMLHGIDPELATYIRTQTRKGKGNFGSKDFLVNVNLF